jgi:hypothetical protein
VLLHHWSWRTWIVIFAVANFFVVLDGTRRGFRNRDKGIEGLQEQINALKSKPSFTGHIYQWLGFPRVALSPKVLQEYLDIVAKNQKVPAREYKCDLDLFVEAYIVNQSSMQVDVEDFGLEIEFQNQIRSLKREPSFTGWVVIGANSYFDPFLGKQVHDPISWAPVPDLATAVGGIMTQGHGASGWLRFVLEDVNPNTIDEKDIRFHRLIVTDGYGDQHSITKSSPSTIKRPKVGHDVQPAK